MGETLRVELVAPQLAAQRPHQVACGEHPPGRRPLSAGAISARAQVFRRIAAVGHLQGGEPQERIRGDGDRRLDAIGSGGAHLRFAGAQERLLVAEVHFDTPAPEIILDDVLERQVRSVQMMKAGWR